MISSLDGNDIFSISRMYQQKYQDELKDYVEVTPPLLLNIAGVTVETGSNSFKEFMILFTKIYESIKSIGSKKIIDPNAKKSEKVREIAIDKFNTTFKLTDVGVAKIGETTLPRLTALVNDGVTTIQLEEDYLTRVGMYEVIDDKLTEWITNAYAHDLKNGASPERTDRLKEIVLYRATVNENQDTITRFDKQNSSDTKAGIYDEYMKLNNNINEALRRMESHFVPWSKIVRSNEVKYNQTETENKIDIAVFELEENRDPAFEITNTVYVNMLKLGEQIKRLPSSKGETVTRINNEITSDPNAIRYNKAVYDLPDEEDDEEEEDDDEVENIYGNVEDEDDYDYEVEGAVNDDSEEDGEF